MKKIYYLKTCDTCKRILKEINDLSSFEIQDIKEQPITEEQLDELYSRTGSYEQLFNKRAQRITALGLKNHNWSEQEYRKYLLEHYTFLARPLVLFGEATFVGNSKKNVAHLLETVNAK